MAVWKNTGLAVQLDLPQHGGERWHTGTLGYLFVFEPQDISTQFVAAERKILQMFVKISTLGTKICHRLAMMMCWRLRVGGLLRALRWLFHREVP